MFVSRFCGKIQLNLYRIYEYKIINLYLMLNLGANLKYTNKVT